MAVFLVDRPFISGFRFNDTETPPSTFEDAMLALADVNGRIRPLGRENCHMPSATPRLFRLDRPAAIREMVPREVPMIATPNRQYRFSCTVHKHSIRPAEPIIGFPRFQDGQPKRPVLEIHSGPL